MITQALQTYGPKAIEREFGSDRKLTVGASEIGLCARRIWWRKKSELPNHSAWGALIRGTMMEEHFWLPAMRAAFGDRFCIAGDSQTTLIEDYLSATPDGLIDRLTRTEKKAFRTKAKSIVAECKSIDPRANLKEAHGEHKAQVTVQMGLVRKLTPWKPTHAVVTYINASFWNEIQEWIIPFDKDLFAAAQARARMIMTATRAEDLKPEGWIAGGSECKFCSYREPCGRARMDLVPKGAKEISPEARAEIEVLAREAKSKKDLAKQSETTAKELEYSIRERLSAEGARQVPGIVAWSTFAGRRGYDMDALRVRAEAAGINIDDYLKPGTPGDILRIDI